MKRLKTKLIAVLAMTMVAMFANSTVVRFETNFGNIDIEMFEQDTPLTVANFLRYVNNGDYDNSIIHRSVPGFIIQGGQYYSTGTQVQAIEKYSSVRNEPGISNTRGTIALAKVNGQVNSGTSNFFFNVSNNNTGSNSLDIQNGGFTVFGEIIDGLEIVDLISSLQTFSEYPLYALYGNTVQLSNYVYIYKAFVLSDEFQINAGLSGAWYNPATDGQGIYLEVLPDINKVIMAWFTFDTSDPDSAASSEVGYAGGRWVTAIGDFQGNEFSGDIYQTSNGLFENSSAAVSNMKVGTVSLVFESCGQLNMNYSMYDGLLNGSTGLRRIAASNIELCEQLASEANPGMVAQ